MKTLDCSHVIDGIDDARSDMDSLREQVGDIQRAVRDFYSMDDALKGKMGESIRDFFQHVNEPLLIYLHQSLIDYDNTLSEMKENVEAFESNEKGFVRQEFLEEEVKEGFDNVEERTTELTEDANNILENVEDLVTVKKIDDSEVLENVEKGKKKANKIVEKLSDLDEQETSQLEKTKETLNEMKSYLSDMKSGLNNGDLSLKNFDIDALRDMDSYSTIMNDIYGDGYVEGKEIEPILDKMLNGENLTGDEREKLYEKREELYNYLQNEYLDDESKAEIESIANSINEEDISDLKKRLNDKVIVSKDALEDELAMVQAYVYIGDKKPGNSHLDDIDKKAKLESYSKLLKNYRSAMEKDEDIVVTIDTLQYEKNPDDIPSHYIKSALQTADYSSAESVMDKQTFREWMTSSENPTAKNFSLSEITYYTGTNAAANHEVEQIQELENELANYTPIFMLNKASKKLVSQIKGVGEAVDLVQTAKEYDSGKQEIEKEVRIGEAQETAIRLDLEFSISKNSTVPHSGEEYEVQLYPQDETYNILERWKEVHKEHPDEIPYPEDKIASNDWYGISEDIQEIELEHGSEVVNKIIDGDGQ